MDDPLKFLLEVALFLLEFKTLIHSLDLKNFLNSNNIKTLMQLVYN